MKFIFFTMPAYGHLNPMLGVARELIKKDHEVIIYNTEEFSLKIRAVGAEFRSYPVKIKLPDLRVMRNALKMGELSLYVSNLLIDPLAKIILKESVDCLIHDSLSLWGKIIGKIINIPTVSLVPSVGINDKVFFSSLKYITPDFIELLRHPLRAVNVIYGHKMFYKRNGITSSPALLDLFTNTEKLNIVFTSDHFQPYRRSFDQTYKFVGPIIYDRNEGKVTENVNKSGRKIIYIAFGTVYNDDLQSYRSLVKLFANTEYEVLVSIGKYIANSELGKVASNISIRQYFPQLEVLKKSSLFISHGGMNSINESLYFGVPMILVPQIQEQRMNSHRVEELGVGIYYKEKNIEEYRLLRIVNEVLNNSSYKKNAEKIGETLKKAGGAEKAVEHILNFLS